MPEDGGRRPKHVACIVKVNKFVVSDDNTYEGRTGSHEQLCFTCELGIADKGECGGRWNQLLCYP